MKIVIQGIFLKQKKVEKRKVQKGQKIICSIKDKRALKQALNHGLKLKEEYRVTRLDLNKKHA